MLEIREKLPYFTVGHYPECSFCNCSNIEKSIESKSQLIFNILDSYVRYDNIYNDAYMKIGFFGNLTYPIATHIYNVLKNYPVRLSIDIFDRELTNCSMMLKNNIEKEMAFGIYNFKLDNIHCSSLNYNVIVCSDILFSYKNRINVLNQIGTVLITGCFVLITDILKKEGTDTTKLENDLDIPVLNTIESYKEELITCNLALVNVLDYTVDLKKHMEILDNKILQENIEKLTYNIIICKKIN